MAAVAEACGTALLDVHTDADHHRSVFTLARPLVRPGGRRAALALALVAVERIDVSVHTGVHPRGRAVDVVPFVAFDDPTANGLAVAGDVARAWGQRVSDGLGGRLSSMEQRTRRDAPCPSSGGRPFESGHRTSGLRNRIRRPGPWRWGPGRWSRRSTVS